MRVARRSTAAAIGVRDRLVVGALALVLLAECSEATEPPGTPSTPGPTSEAPSPSASAEPSPSSDEFVVVAVGDIACHPTTIGFDGTNPRACQDRATAALVGDADAVLTLGDLQYEHGALAAFRAAYDRSWGMVADRTFPTPGNHEYGTPGAAGYFDYWASRGGARPAIAPAGSTASISGAGMCSP